VQTNFTREEMLNKEVMVEDFVKLFEPKDYEGRILNVLNQEIRQRKQELEELRK
jgi:hypothetical protein